MLQFIQQKKYLSEKNKNIDLDTKIDNSKVLVIGGAGFTNKKVNNHLLIWRFMNFKWKIRIFLNNEKF